METAARLPAAIRLGTSSWSFPGWAGLVWADRHAADVLSRDGLPAYARHPLLRAVGLDRTFYAPLPVDELARHAAQVPDGFRFLVKASRLCTIPGSREGPGRGAQRENPRYLDPPAPATRSSARPWRGSATGSGVLLFQFPPLPRSRDPRPGGLRGPPVRLPRGAAPGRSLRRGDPDAALLTPAYAAALPGAGASHGFTVHPTMPPLEAQAARRAGEAQPSLVVRWMLGHGRGYEEARELYAPFDRLAAPDPESRASVAELVRRAVRAGRRGWSS